MDRDKAFDPKEGDLVFNITRRELLDMYEANAYPTLVVRDGVLIYYDSSYSQVFWEKSDGESWQK